MFKVILPFDAADLRGLVARGIQLYPDNVERYLREEMFSSDVGVMANARSIPRQHDARRQFVRLVCDRVRFLPGMRYHLIACAADPATAERSPYFKAAEAMKKANGDKACYLSAMTAIFIKEAAALAGGKGGVFTRGGWVRAPVTLTARINGTEAADFADARLNLLALHDTCRRGNDPAVIAENEGLLFPPVLTGLDVMESGDSLRGSIACAFGLQDAAQFLSLMRSMNFVVTRAIATKLLVLYSFIQTLTPVIQCGPTGVGLVGGEGDVWLVRLGNQLLRRPRPRPSSDPPQTGKTECLVAISLLLNKDSRVRFDACAELKLCLLESELLLPGVSSIASVTADDVDRVCCEAMERMGIEDAKSLVRIVAQRFTALLQRFPQMDTSAHVASVLAEVAEGGGRDTGAFRGSLLATKADLQRFIREAVISKPRDLFHVIQMSNRLTADDWRARVRSIADAARRVPGQTVVGFVDELNTNERPAQITEVLTDRTLDGEPLPSNIVWMGAINPLTHDPVSAEARRDAPAATIMVSAPPTAAAASGAAALRTEETAASDFTGVDAAADAPAASLQYIVYETPPSAAALVRDVGEFAADERPEFLRAMLTDPTMGVLGSLRRGHEGADAAAAAEEEAAEAAAAGRPAPTVDSAILAVPFAARAAARRRDALISFAGVAIEAAYAYVEALALPRIKPSIRDFVRATSLFKFFLTPSPGSERSFFVADVERCLDNAAHDDAAAFATASTTDIYAWCALQLAIALVFYLRLPTQQHRAGLLAHLQSATDRHLQSLAEAASTGSTATAAAEAAAPIALFQRTLPSTHVLDSCAAAFMNRLAVPPGIAHTRSLQHTIFTASVCAEACIGVLLTGPTGVSGAEAGVSV